MVDRLDPAAVSGDYKAMAAYWETCEDLYKGAGAVRYKKERYLPRFDNETPKQYTDRVRWARYTNIYGDIIDNLAAKPFAEEVTIGDESATAKLLSEDIDGQGNNLHNFAKMYFKGAINMAIDWIFVDYTRTNAMTTDASGRARRKSVLEERQSGARPYWVRVSAREMIAVYTAVINGVETFVHCRMAEEVTELVDYEEETVKYVRELNRTPVYNDDGELVGWGGATFILWKQEANGWSMQDTGEIAIGVIPIVPLIIGDRIGTTWQIIGAMKDCADLQIDLYQQEAGLQNARQLTAFPMLSANGVSPETDAHGNVKKVPVGPRAVLYAPPNDQGGQSSWSYVEINASSLKFLASEIKETARELRELGRQPLTASSGQLTTVTTAFAAQKGNSAAQSWAFALKDALEQAFKFTAMWLNESAEPTVSVFTDFEAGIGEDDGFNDVLEMRKAGDLSQETLWDEARRRKRLGDEFSTDRERERLAEEGEDEPDEGDLAAAAAARLAAAMNSNNTQTGDGDDNEDEPDPEDVAA